MMVAVGTSSCSSSSRFGASSTFNLVTPVTLPPGRFRLATSPSCDRVAAGRENDRNRRGRRLGRERRRSADRGDHGHLTAEPDRPPSPAVDRIDPPPSDIRSSRSALDVTGFAQALAERGNVSRVQRSADALLEKPDHRHRRLLRARRERPRDRRAAEERDELASPHARPQAQETALYRLKRVL